MPSATIGIRELKSHLSAYLQRVKAGETVVITERGRPVGRILPIEESLEKAVQHLGEAGLLAWSGRKLGRSRPAAPAPRGERTVSELLLEDRE